ncbi:unnamed protein product [Brassica oleracea var. botrytis]|uniref:(rape) hypothetical protein n=1 Tax=Brassica napus TaxID=3708 RepID=A0A816JF27_BRANA|nr:unnamed protein product [Brassica napus]
MLVVIKPYRGRGLVDPTSFQMGPPSVKHRSVGSIWETRVHKSQTATPLLLGWDGCFLA